MNNLNDPTAATHSDALVRERRRVRNLWLALVILALGAALLALQAERMRRQAEQSAQDARAALQKQQEAQQAAAETAQRAAEAQTEARFNRVGQLAAEAQAALNGSPQTGLLLAVEAARLDALAAEGDHNIQSLQALIDGLQENSGIGFRSGDPAIDLLQVSADGRWLVSGSQQNAIKIRDLHAADGYTHPQTLAQLGRRDQIKLIGAEGRWLLLTDENKQFRLWDLDNLEVHPEPYVYATPDVTPTVVTISSDNRWLAWGEENEMIRVQDIPSQAAPLGLHLANPGCFDARCPADRLAISSNRRWLAAASSTAAEYVIQLWDLQAGERDAKPQILRGHTGKIDTLLISPDGRWLVSAGDDQTLRLWDLQAKNLQTGGVVLKQCNSNAHADRVTISMYGQWLAAGGENEPIWIWNLRSDDPERTLRVFSAPQGSPALTFSLDEHWLVAGGSEDPVIRRWNLQAEKSDASPLALRGHGRQISALVTAPDGSWVITANQDGEMHGWNLGFQPSSNHLFELGGHNGVVHALALSPDGHWLATVGDNDNEIRLCDLQSQEPGKNLRILRGHQQAVFELKISADGDWLASASRDGTARVWDLRAEDPGTNPLVLGMPPGNREWGDLLTIGPDGHWLAVGGSTIWLWNLQGSAPATGEPLKLATHDRVASPNGGWLMVRSVDNVLQLWNLQAKDLGVNPQLLRGNETEGTFLALSSDGHRLAVQGAFKTVRLWNLQAPNPSLNAQVLHGLEGDYWSLIFSPDGHWLVSESENFTNQQKENGVIQLWDLSSQTAELNPAAEYVYGPEIRNPEISPDGHWLALGGKPWDIRLWDLRSKDPSAYELVLHQYFSRGVWGLTFRADGRRLAVGDGDGEVKVWNLNPDELIQPACQVAGRNLNQTEWKRYFPGEPYRVTCPQFAAEEK